MGRGSAGAEVPADRAATPGNQSGAQRFDPKQRRRHVSSVRGQDSPGRQAQTGSRRCLRNQAHQRERYLPLGGRTESGADIPWGRKYAEILGELPTGGIASDPGYVKLAVIANRQGRGTGRSDSHPQFNAGIFSSAVRCCFSLFSGGRCCRVSLLHNGSGRSVFGLLGREFRRRQTNVFRQYGWHSRSSDGNMDGRGEP